MTPVDPYQIFNERRWHLLKVSIGLVSGLSLIAWLMFVALFLDSVPGKDQDPGALEANTTKTFSGCADSPATQVYRYGMVSVTFWVLF